MSAEPPHGATEIHASKGNGSKWLIGAAVAAVLIGSAVYATTQFGPSQPDAQMAYNEQSSADTLRAGPLEQNSAGDAQIASADESIAPPPEQRTTTTARRTTTRATPVPEETIGLTPVSYSTDSDEIVVPGSVRPIWSRTPSARRLSELYPERALSRGHEGEASLHCTVQGNGALACVPVSESPAREGFGTAAVRVASRFRHAPQLADGSASAGSPVNLHVIFRMADDQRRG